MNKRRLIRWSLILAILAAFAVWLEPTRVVWGWLRGEAFYQGRPTSFWRTELSRWERQLWGGGENRLPAERWVRHKTGLEAWLDRTLGKSGNIRESFHRVCTSATWLQGGRGSGGRGQRGQFQR